VAEGGVLSGLGDRLLEVLAVILLGVTTMGTAWCGYQSATWSSTGSQLSEVAAGQRIEASRQFGLATQVVTYDSTIVAQYAAAHAEGNEPLLTFYRETLVRPGFLPVLERWEAEVKAGGRPQSLAEDAEYLEAQFAGYRESSAAAEEAMQASTEAGQNANSYIALTILLAAALFFAGVTSSFRFVLGRVLLLLAATAIVVGVAARLASLPVT
jgi:hypothetical protein